MSKKSSSYEYQKVWRANNREKWNKMRRDSEKRHPDVVSARRRRYRVRHAESIKKSRLAAKQKISDFLDDYKFRHGCSVCGENDPVVLDFHHIGEKKETISLLRSKSWRIERIQGEIDKCIVLCANCHRRTHKGQILII